MSPEQMANLTRQVGSMSPGMMQTAMDQMKNMGSNDWDRAKQQMDSMSPEEIQRQTSQAASHLASQEQYVLNVSPRPVAPVLDGAVLAFLRWSACGTGLALTQISQELVCDIDRRGLCAAALANGAGVWHSSH
jgi:hypothetical protein